MYSVPLRRALVTGTDLPYPEGVAAAEVLKVGAGRRRGARRTSAGWLRSSGARSSRPAFAMLAKTKLLAAEAARRFRVGAGATGVSASLSLALIGVGHLVGLAVGIAMLVGLLISWACSCRTTPRSPAIAARRRPRRRSSSTCSATKVRFIGAGTIGVAAIWTLLKIIGPIIAASPRPSPPAARASAGGQDSLAADRARHADRHRRRHHPRAR